MLGETKLQPMVEIDGQFLHKFHYFILCEQTCSTGIYIVNIGHCFEMFMVIFVFCQQSPSLVQSETDHYQWVYWKFLTPHK